MWRHRFCSNTKVRRKYTIDLIIASVEYLTFASRHLIDKGHECYKWCVSISHIFWYQLCNHLPVKLNLLTLGWDNLCWKFAIINFDKGYYWIIRTCILDAIRLVKIVDMLSDPTSWYVHVGNLEATCVHQHQYNT